MRLLLDETASQARFGPQAVVSNPCCKTPSPEVGLQNFCACWPRRGSC